MVDQSDPDIVSPPSPRRTCAHVSSSPWLSEMCPCSVTGMPSWAVAVKTSLESSSSVSPSSRSTILLPPKFLHQPPPPLDVSIGRYIRSVIDRDPEWTAFVDSRRRALTAREQLEQFRYVEATLRRFVGQTTPANLVFVGSKAVTPIITKAHVMRAFNLPLSWEEKCAQVLALTALYGPSGTRGENPRVVRALDDPPAVTSKFTTERYRRILKEVHRRWTISGTH